MAEDKIGVYFCHCGTNIAGKVDVADVVEWAATQPGGGRGAGRTRHVLRPGAGPDQETTYRELGLNRVVVAACSPTMHEPTFRKAAGDACLNPFLLQMANVREHCSWVTVDPIAATAKAKRILERADPQAAVQRAAQPHRGRGQPRRPRGRWRHCRH